MFMIFFIVFPDAIKSLLSSANHSFWNSGLFISKRTLTLFCLRSIPGCWNHPAHVRPSIDRIVSIGFDILRCEIFFPNRVCVRWSRPEGRLRRFFRHIHISRQTLLAKLPVSFEILFSFPFRLSLMKRCAIPSVEAMPSDCFRIEKGVFHHESTIRHRPRKFKRERMLDRRAIGRRCHLARLSEL